MIGWLARTWGVEGGAIENETNNNESKVDTFNLVLGIVQTDREVRNDTATEDRNIGFFDFLFGSPSNESNYIDEVSSDCTSQAFSRDRVHTSSRTLDDIVVEGGSRFVNHVNRCVDELRGTRWEPLVSELRKVSECSNYGDSGVSRGVYKAYSGSMGLSSWNNDCIQGASVLIHEAVHTEREFSGEFDDYNYAGEELIAIAEQAQFFRFHGRHADAAYLETRDGRHNEPYMSPELLALQR